VHSGKALPSAVLALGEDLTPLADGRRRFFFIFFPECNTRERFLNFFLKYSLPSAAAQALGKEICFFLKKTSLPSAAAQALGEATSKNSFFCFFLFHVNNKAYIYITNHKSTPICHKPHLYITNDQICPKSTIYYKPHVQKYPKNIT